MSRIAKYKKTMNGARAVKPLRNEDGIVLILALVLMMALSALGLTIVYTSTANIHISGNSVSSTQAFMAAEAGLAEAMDKIRGSSNWGPDLDGDGSASDDASEWDVESTGTIDLGDTEATYTTTLYDSTGSYGREDNSSRLNRYVTLSGDDILIEVTASANGLDRSVSLVVRPKMEAFEYAIFSEGGIDGTGSGDNPGTLIGKFYGKKEIKLQGNYVTGDADMESTKKVSPNCNSGKFNTCDDDHDEVDAPLLDFAYYQDQDNFDSQQVIIMKPSVGKKTSCGHGCKTWKLYYEMEPLGETYTAYAESEDDETTVYWCSNTSWPAEEGVSCDGIGGSYTYGSDDVKTVIGAEQFNAYTAPDGYSSTIVNIIDADEEIEFIGPEAGETATIYATILVGTSSGTDSPDGKINFYGNGGRINFMPANGLAVVADEVDFKAKYGDFDVKVGNIGAGGGAIILAGEEAKFEGGKDKDKKDKKHDDDDDDDKKDKKHDDDDDDKKDKKHDDDDDEDNCGDDEDDVDGDDDDDVCGDDEDDKKGKKDDDGHYELTVNFYGSLVVGGDESVGDDDHHDNADVELDGKGNGTTLNFTYVKTANTPTGWIEEGSNSFERLEWMEHF